jgi:phosphoglucosamine mutase
LVLDKHTTGDGLVSALQVLQACVRSGKTMAQWLEPVALFPQVMINVKLQPDQDWQGNVALQKAIDKVQQEIAGNGRLLIRASGTEPLLRVMVEAPEEQRARQWAQSMADAIRA